MRQFIAVLALIAWVGACDDVKLDTPSLVLPDAAMSDAEAGGTGGASASATGGLGGEAGAAVGGAASCGANEDCSTGVCDLEQGMCVECLVDATCGEMERCRRNACEPRLTCGVGLATCPANYPICDLQHLQCEECLRTPQCGPGMACTNYTCTPLPSCSDDDECLAIQYCDAGQCRPDTCVPGGRVCNGSTVLECLADGHTMIPLDCECDEGRSTCIGRVCNLGDTSFCEDDKAMHCVNDGYSWEVEDCPGLGLHCLDGACEDLVCSPGAIQCLDGDVSRCAPDGSSWIVELPCAGLQVCDPSSNSCAPGCTPGEPVCENNNVRTCAVSGLGFQGPSTDCGDLTCSNGTCVDCDDLDVHDAFRFTFVMGDGVAFKNISGCPFDVADVWFSLVQDTSSINVPGSAALWQGDQWVFNGSNPETLPAALKEPVGMNLMLCAVSEAEAGAADGGLPSGCSVDQVIDFVQLGSGAPTAPTGVTWTGNLMPNLAAEDLIARTRFRSPGASYFAADWELVPP